MDQASELFRIHSCSISSSIHLHFVLGFCQHCSQICYFGLQGSNTVQHVPHLGLVPLFEARKAGISTGSTLKLIHGYTNTVSVRLLLALDTRCHFVRFHIIHAHGAAHLRCRRGIGSTTSTRRLCDLSSAGKFGRGEAEAKPKEDKPHNLLVNIVDLTSTTDINSKSS